MRILEAFEKEPFFESSGVKIFTRALSREQPDKIKIVFAEHCLSSLRKREQGG